MAVEKFTTWDGSHSFSNYKLTMQYDVYADMANGSTTPYLLLNKCRVRSKNDSQTELAKRVPLTLKIKVNNTGTVYTFNSGSTIKHRQGTIYDEDTGMYQDGYYYVEFSSSTHIPIKKNGETFTLDLTATTKNSETNTVTEHCCAPVSNVLSGSASIYTGNVATYTMSASLKNDASHEVSATMHIHFPSEGVSMYTYDGHASEYVPAWYSTTAFNKVSFVPLRHNATDGDKAKANTDGDNYIEVLYYYYTGDSGFGTKKDNTSNSPRRILISKATKGVTVTARAEVNAALKPVFKSLERWDNGSYGSVNIPLATQVAKYGGAVQNNSYYRVWLNYLNSDGYGTLPYYPHTVFDHANDPKLKYGAYFSSCVVTDYAYSSTKTGKPQPRGAWVDYDHGFLTKAGSNLVVQYKFTDSYGFTTTYTDKITVIPYSNPAITTHRVRRCSRVSGTPSGTVYTYDGVQYQLDDYGEYALFEWGVNFSSLNDQNSRYLSIREPIGNASSGMVTREITLPSYVCSGYYVKAVNSEYSYNIEFTVRDDFKTVTVTEPLSTALAALDFLRGGTGIGFGKVAEETYTADINRAWTIMLPYNTMIQNYNQDGTAVRLYTWMQNTINRMDQIVASRDVAVWVEHFYDGNTAVALPSGSCKVHAPTDSSADILVDTMSHNTSNGVFCGVLIGGGLVASRNYIRINMIEAKCFVSQGWVSTGKCPELFVMTSKPTSINQSTGKPNGTIIKSMEITGGSYQQVGNSNDGYTEYEVVKYPIYLDISSARGQTIWFAAVAKNGGASPSGHYYDYRSYIRMDTILLTDRRT